MCIYARALPDESADLFMNTARLRKSCNVIVTERRTTANEGMTSADSALNWTPSGVARVLPREAALPDICSGDLSGPVEDSAVEPMAG